jgi:diaminohydroxyphosphoribosylaminopyrimidine deaminase/5-amino-6-(5-phosphoribosylamino)uracil reductase
MELNTGFIKRMTQQRPWVGVKMAMSLDGRTALANGVSQWITGESARHDVQYLRARSSAILSTAKTVISDDASLNVRLNSQQLGQTVPVRQPVRVVLDENLELTGRERLFTTPGKIWIFTCSTDQELIENLQSSSVKIFNLPPGADGLMDLNKLMLLLAEYEINEVHTECGATLAGALLKRQLVDELVVYQAPKLLGSAARGLVDLGEISIMSDTIQLNLRDVRNIGDDIRITAAPEYPCLPS